MAKVIAHEPDELTRLVLPKQMTEEIKSYCLSSPDKEVCGLIGGMGEIGLHFYPIKNVADDPEHQYFMDAAEQLAAFKTLRQRAEHLLAIMHSHPSSPAEPSQTDLELASYPGVAYVIVSLLDQTTAYRSYLYHENQFSEIPLEIV